MSQQCSRRSFFKGAAGAAAAVGVGGLRPVEAAWRPRASAPLRLGLMTWTLGSKWDLDTLIRNCAEAKFEHLQLRTTHAHGVEVGLNKAQRREVRQKIEASPISALSLASGFAYHDPDPAVLRKNIEGTKEYTLLAHDLGAQGIRVFPNALLVDKGVPEEQTLRQIGRALREVGEFAKDYGVEIRLEVHGRETDYVPRVRKMIDYSECDNVFVLWNSTANDLSGAGFEANFRSVADRIRNVHLHELWLEEYPYRQLFALLRQVGYNGYCDAEIPDTDSEDPVRLMKYYRALFLAYQDAL